MATPARFFLEQAQRCAQAAAATELDNQRETFLRSEAAWQALADRELATQAARAERERARTEETNDEP